MTKEVRIFPATGMPDDDWWNALWPDPLDVLQKLGLAKDTSAIDLCCGNGHFTVPMTMLLNGNVTAVDLNADLLAQAKKRVATVNAPDCNWILGDAMELAAITPEQVDTVLIANTFHGVPNQTELSAEVAKVLKPGGRFIVINWHALPRDKTPVLDEPRGPNTEMRMSPDEVRTVVEPTGLIFGKIVELPPYHYGIIFEKP